MREPSILEAYVDAMMGIMTRDPAVVVLTADLAASCRLVPLFDAFPDRCFDFGIAEQNMVGAAAGFAKEGLRPHVHTFAAFLSMRACEQVRTSILYPGFDVKLTGTHCGVSHSISGSTHFAIEDVGIFRSMPGSTIVVPCDAYSTRVLTGLASEIRGPVYMRLDRNALPAVYGGGETLSIGKGSIPKNGTDLAIVAMGSCVGVALKAAETLKVMGLSVAVVDMHTVKPLDHGLVRGLGRATANIVTLEDHNTTGGLGSAVCEAVATDGIPARVLRLGIDEFYPNGWPLDGIKAKVGMDTATVVRRVSEAMGLGRE